MKRTIGWFLVVALAAVSIAACSAARPESTTPALSAATTPLIDRETLFGNPDKAAVRLSPDGTRISFLAAVEGVLNVWVGPVDDPSAAKPVTTDRGRGVRQYFWAFNNRNVLYLQDKDGDENWRVYSVDLASGETRDLTPVAGVRAEVLGVSHKWPDTIVVGLNDRVAEYHDVYLVNVETGSRTLAQRNDEFAGFLVDDDYTIRFAEKMNPDGGKTYFAPKGDGFEPFLTIGRDDMLTTGFAGFDATGRTVYMIDSRDRNTAALVGLSLDTGATTTYYADDRADVSGALVHPTKYTVQAAASTYERTEWKILDPDIEKDWTLLESKVDGDLQVTDRTLDDARWMVVGFDDDGPVRYYLYDRNAGTVKFLFTNKVGLEKAPLVPMHAVQVKTRDGLTLVNYLSMPASADADGDGRPERPLPMVLSVHGGPWSRMSWGFNPWHQWLANRGYAVLDVNFRGSTGFGKAFINAADLEWGAKMHDDLIDSVDWAVAQGIAQKDKIAIMGGSYGGYATLVGVTMTPDVFACGVDIVGPSNLVTLIESIPPYWKPMLDLFTTRVGDPRTDEGRAFLLERSPLTHADAIRKPLLIGQGANDPRVKQAESDQIVGAMKTNKIGVTYVLYPDEGHGFARPENRLSFYAVTEAFLSECLGGRYEPVGKDFEGSTIQVPEGADLVPGVAAALPKN